MLKFLFVCALGVFGCSGIDEQQSCDEQCTPTYPLHTYPQVKRGRRYRIDVFVMRAHDNTYSMMSKCVIYF